MAISIIGTPQTGTGNNGNPVTLTWSTTPSTNDYTVVVVGSPAATATDCTMTTTGYTRLAYHTGAAAANPSIAVFYKKQGASPDATAVTVADGDATTDTTAIGFVLRGVDPTTFSDATPTTAGETTSTNPDPASITVGTAGACVIVTACMTVVMDSAITAPSGYTGYSVLGSDTADNTLAAAYKLNCTGTEAPASWTNWDSGLWYAITIAVKPYVEVVPDNASASSTSTLADSVTISQTNNISVSDTCSIVDSIPDVLVDSYSESNQDSNYGGTPTWWVGQSFTGNGGVLNSAKFYLKTTGSPAPTGTATVYIYNHTGIFGTSSVPTGSALASSVGVDISTISTSYGLITFTFSGVEKITLENSTNYCAVVGFSGSGFDGIHNVSVGIDVSSPTHEGNCFTGTEGSWQGYSNFDTCFYVYASNPTITSGPADRNSSASDTCTLADSITVNQTANIFVSDTCTLTDATTITISPLFATPTADVCTAGESVVASEPQLYINNSETCTVGEIVLINQTANISVSDTSTLADTVDVNTTRLVSISETCTLADSIDANQTRNASTSDTCTLTDTITADGMNIGITETCTVWDIPQYPDNIIWVRDVPIVEIYEFATAASVEASDTCTLADSITVSQIIVLVVSETCTLADAITASEPKLYISVSDTATLADAITIYVNVYNISVSDTCTLADSVVASEPVLYISRSDTATLTDAITSKGGDAVAVVSDTCTLSDSLTVYENAFNISVSDTSTLSDTLLSVGGACIAECSDTATVTDVVEGIYEYEVLLVTGSDTCTVGELIDSIGGDCVAETSDTCTVGEDIVYSETPELISVSDTCTLSDSITAYIPPHEAVVSDTCSAREHFHICIKRWWIRPPTAGAFAKKAPTAGVWAEVPPTSASWTKQTSTGSWTKKTPTSATWGESIKCEC